MPSINLPSITFTYHENSKISHSHSNLTHATQAIIVGKRPLAISIPEINDVFVTPYDLQFYSEHNRSFGQIGTIRSIFMGRETPPAQHLVPSGREVHNYTVFSEMFTSISNLDEALHARSTQPVPMADVVTVNLYRMRLSDILTNLYNAGGRYETIHCLFPRTQRSY